MKFLRIIHSCVAFGRNVAEGDVFNQEEIQTKYRADVDLLKGVGLAEVIERYEAPAEAVEEPDPEADEVEDLEPLEQAQTPVPEQTSAKSTKEARKKAKK